MPRSANKDEARTGRQAAVPASRYFVFLLIFASGLAADLSTKSWVFGRLWPPGPGVPARIWLWPCHVGLEVSLNEGALFGLGQGQGWLFISLSLIAAVAIIYWLFYLGEARDWWLSLALAGIMAGIFGNFYDRLGLHGLTWPPNYLGHNAGDRAFAVRDWILLQWNDSLPWPNFNIADSLLVCGAATMFVHAFRPPSLNPESDRSSSAGALR